MIQNIRTAVNQGPVMLLNELAAKEVQFLGRACSLTEGPHQYGAFATPKSLIREDEENEV